MATSIEIASLKYNVKCDYLYLCTWIGNNKVSCHKYIITLSYKQIPNLCVKCCGAHVCVASNLQHKDSAQCDKNPNLMAMSALSTIVVNHNNPWKPWKEFTEKDNHKSELSLVNYKRVNRSNGTSPTLFRLSHAVCGSQPLLVIF